MSWSIASHIDSMELKSKAEKLKAEKQTHEAEQT